MFVLKRSLADRLFSQYIRTRADWRCERCGTQYESPTIGLQCSHFHGRAKKSVRWDVDNAFALCTGCHTYLGSNPNEHREFARKRLGERKFDLLTLRANTPQKVDQKLIVLALRALLKDLEAEKDSGEIIYGKKAS